MPTMISPAGEMEIKIFGVEVDKNKIIVAAEFGAWDSKIYMNPKDILQIVKMMFKLRVVFYFLRLPFLLIKKM